MSENRRLNRLWVAGLLATAALACSGCPSAKEEGSESAPPAAAASVPAPTQSIAPAAPEAGAMKPL